MAVPLSSRVGRSSRLQRKKICPSAMSSRWYSLYTSVRTSLSDEKASCSMSTLRSRKSADIILPDGSIAYLHPGSRLRFPTDFSGQQRIVILEGEAYFKVKHDSSRPFVVMADGMQTTVLGTEFHVSSHNHEVVLVTGSVRVSNEGQQVMLRPHQQCSFANGGCSTADVDVTPYEMWRDGYLYFDNVELRTILEAIGQNFNMTVEFRNTDALHYKMRFISERNKGPQAAIDMMNRMKKVSVRQEGNRLIVE